MDGYFIWLVGAVALIAIICITVRSKKRGRKQKEVPAPGIQEAALHSPNADVDESQRGQRDPNFTVARSAQDIEKPKPRPSPASAPANQIYVKKPLLTERERVLYHKTLASIELFGFRVIPQVNLATIIDKVNNEKYRNELFRNIDFGIFDKEFNPLLLVEFNDSSHNRPDRRSRDNKVKNITEQAGIKLITFWTKYPNELIYVHKRILDELNINAKPGGKNAHISAQKPELQHPKQPLQNNGVVL